MSCGAVGVGGRLRAGVITIGLVIASGEGDAGVDGDATINGEGETAVKGDDSGDAEGCVDYWNARNSELDDRKTLRSARKRGASTTHSAGYSGV